MSQYGRFMLGTGAAPIEHINVGGGTVNPSALGGIAITDGANISWTPGVSTMQADLTGTAQFSLQLGNAAGSLSSLGVAANGQIPIGSAGANPVLGVPIDGTNISWSTGAGTLQADLVATVGVALGGTGVTTLTDHGVLVGSGAGAITPLTVGLNGQVLVGSGAADPVFATITSTDATIDVAGGAGTLDLDLSGNLQSTAVHSFNGTTIEWMDMTVTAAGGVITFSVEKSGGGDLTAVFSDGFYDWNCTPADTVVLTAGTDTAPQNNYVYLDQGTKTLTANITGMPLTEVAPIARILCQSAASLQTDGAYSLHSCRGSLSDTTGKGLSSIVACWIARYHANWLSGVTPTLTITPQGAAPDNVIFTSTAGIVVKLARRTFPIFAGTPDIYTVNDSVTPYNIVTDLNALLTDSVGGAMSGKYFTLVVWGVVNENTGDCKLMVNLPGGFYNTEALLVADAKKYANFSIPSAFKGTGFLIYQMNLRHQVAAGGTWTSISNIDLRGLLPCNTAGGSTSFATEFEDNIFRILDDGDNTKELAFEVSGVNTGTTRTITMDDRDIDLDAVATTISTDSGNAVPAAGTLTIAGGGAIATSGAGSTVTITGGGTTWSAITANQSIVSYAGYICNKAGLLTLTLPASAAVGTFFEVTGINTDVGWRVAQGAGQQIHFGNQSTTGGAGGYIESIHKRDSVKLVCVIVNTDWNIVSSVGNITIT